MFKLSHITSILYLSLEKKKKNIATSLYFIKKDTKAVLNRCNINGSRENWNGQSFTEDICTVL